MWQLLSEPDAGSDLAGVKMRALRAGDEYVLNGQKVFIGSDNGTDWMWTLAVTDPNGERHKNLSWFMVDASLPGITIQPMDLLGAGEGSARSGQKNTIFLKTCACPRHAWWVARTTDGGWRQLIWSWSTAAVDTSAATASGSIYCSIAAKPFATASR